MGKMRHAPGRPRRGEPGTLRVRLAARRRADRAAPTPGWFRSTQVREHVFTVMIMIVSTKISEHIDRETGLVMAEVTDQEDRIAVRGTQTGDVLIETGALLAPGTL